MDVRAGAALTKRALVTGIAGQDGSYLAELLLERGYDVVGIVRDRAGRSVPEPRRRARPGRARAGESARPGRARRRAARARAARGLQPRVAVVRADVVAAARRHRRVRGRRRDVAARGDPRRRPRRSASTRRRRARSSASRRRCRRPRRRGSRRSRRTASRRRTATSSSTRTAAATGCTRAAGSSTTTSRRGGPSTSCRARSRTPRRRSRSGSSSELLLGDLGAQRDWGYAGDYVEAMWRMLQQDEPGGLRDRDRATLHTRRGARRARVRARRARLARATSRWTSRCCAGQAELHDLVGDASKARERLGWEPQVGFEDLVRLLVDAALEGLRRHEFVTPPPYTLAKWPISRSFPSTRSTRG